MVTLSLTLLLLGASPELPRVAVLGFTSHDELTAAKARSLEELVLTELSRGKRLAVIGSADMASMLGLERQRQLLGCNVELSCMAEIGAALGAPYLVAGAVSRAGSQLRVDLKLLEVNSGKVLAREGEVIAREDDWFTVTAAMTRRLELGIPGLAATETSARPAWPFVVTGVGVAAAAAGGVMMGVAKGNADAALASGRTGALTSANVATAYDSAAQLHTAGIGVLIGGGGVAAVGVVLTLITGTPTVSPVAVVPLRDGAAVSFGGQF